MADDFDCLGGVLKKELKKLKKLAPRTEKKLEPKDTCNECGRGYRKGSKRTRKNT